MISIRFRFVRGRKPTAMYTALVAQQDGEYRYVNSRLLTNAQGLALNLVSPSPFAPFALSRYIGCCVSIGSRSLAHTQTKASRWKKNKHKILQYQVRAFWPLIPPTVPSGVRRDRLLQGQREGETGAAGGVREACVDYEAIRALPPLPRRIGLCGGQVLRHHRGVDGRVSPLHQQGPPTARQQHAGRGLSR